MIASLQGKLLEKAADRVVISVGGVGFEAQVSSTTLKALPATGRPAHVFTHLAVRDDSLTLYGFADTDERTVFTFLIGVTGVGPKVALAVLSVLSPDALRRAVLAGDVDAITVVPGVGKKVAARLILDLKDKLGLLGSESPVSGPLGEVREALIALGLSAQEARDALAALPSNGDRPVEDLLRDALRTVRPS
ncbi:MAG: Holliday junction branch migration protein RuvA [Actinobacteria bacterium]|nr:Holliday junction branch migration protein RuvA [Actinomycetota bacterium]